MIDRLAFRKALTKQGDNLAAILEAIAKDARAMSRRNPTSVTCIAYAIHAEYVETLAMAARIREASMRREIEREENDA